MSMLVLCAFWSLICYVITAVILLSFFFFQAEDGIRDLTVTGVQTCALPISLPAALGPAGSGRRRDSRRAHLGRRRRSRAGRLARVGDGLRPRGGAVVGRRTRSEERRVGKEGRSRWSPYH